MNEFTPLFLVFNSRWLVRFLPYDCDMMSSSLRTTRHLIRWFSRNNWGHREIPIVSFGIRRISSASIPWLSPSNLGIKQSKLITSNQGIRRLYSSDGNVPSHKRVPLPALSPTMERGSIVSWEKKEGDRLNEGDLLAEIETDKATMGFETPEEGYLAKIMVPGGSKDVPIGKIVCIIVENEADIAAFKDFVISGEEVVASVKPIPPSSSSSAKVEKPVAAAKKPVAPAPLPPTTPTTSKAPSGGSRVFASPYARKLAAEKGFDVSLIGRGSGSDGRIVAEDVVNFKGSKQASSVSSGQFTNLPLTTVKQENYSELLEWKKKVPQYYLTVEVKLDNILKLRDELNSVLSKEADKITETDFIIKASALACQAIPQVNSSWQDTHIRQYNTININVIHNTDEGVFAPVISAVEKKGLASINKNLLQLKSKVAEGNLQPHEIQVNKTSNSQIIN
ncbi:hypothetical protein CHUAL_008977 [Chamberlinius hualienensis]